MKFGLENDNTESMSYRKDVCLSPPRTTIALEEAVVEEFPTTTSLVTMRRPRPSTKLTPDAKRQKPESPEESEEGKIDYPTSIPVPSKRIISALVDQVLSLESNEDNSNQAHLKPAGVLSFEQVLLPALALEEEKALKRLQAKIQRDAPHHKAHVETCRKMVRKCIQAAVVAVQQARLQRMEVHTQRCIQEKERRRKERLEQKHQEKLEKQRQAELAREQRKEDRQKRFLQLQRQYPRNKDLWREIVVLTRSVTQMEKEERMWQQAQQDLHATAKPQQSNTESSDNSENSIHEGSSDYSSVKKDMLQEQTESTIQDMVLASTRIQQGLGQVLKILESSEKVRQELYQTYRKDHQFQGYLGINNPRSLIRFLSQED